MMKLGRNDPCHCGSGKKYKHCHYEEDRAAETKALREAAEQRAAELKAKAEEESDGEENDGAFKGSSKDGSRFLRDSSRGGHSQTSSAGRSPRSTRGAQRGG